MNFLNSIFGKPKEHPPLDHIKFRGWVRESIHVIGLASQDAEHKEIRQLLVENGIPEYEAGEILIFLPTAFCRELLPELKWPDQYIDYYSENESIARRYKDNERYVIIEQEILNYWGGNPSSKMTMNIVRRSADFIAINKLLKEGGTFIDIELTESYILRYE
jgi:hypothetical protein